MITQKDVFKDFTIGAIAFIWAFATAIAIVHNFNTGDTFHVICGIVSFIGLCFLAYKGFVYFSDEVTNHNKKNE